MELSTLTVTKIIQTVVAASQSRGFAAVHNMPHLVGATGACENTDTLVYGGLVRQP